MNLYPLTLVLAVAVASATLFFGYLPARRLEAHFFTRWTLRLGGLWLVVAALTPTQILHYDVLIALLCFIAWRQLHGGHGLRGKLWLCLAAGFGLSLGPVLVLAVTPGAWPDASPAWARLLFLASLYTGGAIPGAAFALYLFTRREASAAGINPSGYARALGALIAIRAVLELAACAASRPIAPWGSLTWRFFTEERIIVLSVFLLALPILGRVARKKVNSPRPSTAGMALSLIMIFGMAAEILSIIS
jgi:hypothetical protein